MKDLCGKTANQSIIVLFDLYTILLTDESEVLANLKDKIFQISYNRFLQIPFRYCFRHIQEIKHIIIKKKRCQLLFWILR